MWTVLRFDVVRGKNYGCKIPLGYEIYTYFYLMLPAPLLTSARVISSAVFK
jgi:hypothetical protein